MNGSPVDSANSPDVTQERSVRIKTGSRLHFGLLDTADPFGGVGVMIDHPATEVVVATSDQFVCDDPAESRIRAIAERVARSTQRSGLPNCRVTVKHRAAAHCGLGSGTQIAMAAAEGLCRFLGIDVDPRTLAIQVAERGKRSAVGVHGYFSGGLIFESATQQRGQAAQQRGQAAEQRGQAAEQLALNRLQNRVELPSHWCVGVFQPQSDVDRVSGEFEREQFAHLSPADGDTATALRRIVAERMLPAAENNDFEAFASSIHQYNEASGRLFESVQGGPYNGVAVTQFIRWLLDHGAEGVGQSSWGPGVFAWFDSAEKAEMFAKKLPTNVELMAISHPRNQPRDLFVNDQPEGDPRCPS